jgi:thiosulfate/3-mercaptopyruvate sulfurtransferase
MRLRRHRGKLDPMQYKTLIDAQSLARLIGRAGVVIVDCRFDLAAPEAGREAFVAGHVPTAVHADLNRDLSARIEPHTGRHPLPERAEFARTLGGFGIDRQTQVIAYDAANGMFAARLWWMLRWLGHAGVAVLDGGFAAWKAHGGAVQSGPAPAATPRQFTPGAALESLRTSAEVAAALASGGHLIVDARAPERFSGAVEPLDPVAGHVPTAINAPFAANLGADGGFLPPQELRARWLARLGTHPPERVIAMCGSGVSACHDLLALAAAGLPGAALYAGSWSEWIRDPSRPTATGAA